MYLLTNMGYKENRKRVYQIYNIDIDDKSYNCHHIITRQDFKIGLVSSDYDINAVSNLIPMKLRDHNKLHRDLYFTEKNSLPKKKLDEKVFPLKTITPRFVPQYVARVPELPFIGSHLNESDPSFWSWLKYQKKDDFFTRQELHVWQQQDTL